MGDDEFIAALLLPDRLHGRGDDMRPRPCEFAGHHSAQRIVQDRVDNGDVRGVLRKGSECCFAGCSLPLRQFLTEVQWSAHLSLSFHGPQQRYRRDPPLAKCDPPRFAGAGSWREHLQWTS